MKRPRHTDPSPTAAPTDRSRCTVVELRNCLLAAAALLEEQAQAVNALNVFPVPDGDTGANMSLTMRAAVRDLEDEAGLPATVAEVAARVEYGALMGARGNSGVILSQILRGFARGLQGKTDCDAVELAAAFDQASTMAYKAVIKPVEGTMLTVIREAAAAAQAAARMRNDLVFVLAETLTAARASLERTPDLLDLLRQAGVVDAGGQGLVLLLEGAYRYASGEQASRAPVAIAAPAVDLHAVHAHHPDDYGYCVNFLLSGRAMPYDEIRLRLAGMGQSTVVVGHEEMIRVHLHSLHPGEALEYALRFGSLSQIKIDNMDTQHADFQQRAAPTPSAATAEADLAPLAVLSVSSGPGFSQIMTSLGASGVIAGGQTMNPSAEDILAAIGTLPQDEIIVLPNNGNIIMAARQAAELTDKRIAVVPTKTTPQGLAALLAFHAEASLADNVAAMTAAAESVRTGEITRASRSVELHGVQVQAGQTIALLDDTIVASSAALDEALLRLLEAMQADSAELITLYYGQAVGPDARAQVERLVGQRYPSATVELLEGGQPFYDFILTVE